MSIVSRYSDVCERIASSCVGAGRDVGDVTLLAVSKNFGIVEIESLLDLGHRYFAENRVQEAASKWVGLRSAYADIELHLVGSLQSNKVREAVSLFDVIQTLDRERLARRLLSEIELQGRDIRLFIQVNMGDESQKSGISWVDLSDFHKYVSHDLGLSVIGLMGIPPFGEDPSPYFGLLHKRCLALGLEHLSMGMSSDYELAIGFGADYVRVGTALFGERIV